MEFNTYFELTQLYASYARVVDSNAWDEWTELFIDDCRYKVQPRENYERNYPLCTLSLESKGMLKDRVYGIRETLFHDPYYQRHVVGSPVVHRVEESGRIHSEANYAVFRTRLSKESTVFNVGRSFDEIVRTEAGLRFASRLFVYDSELIPNSLIYPI